MIDFKNVNINDLKRIKLIAIDIDGTLLDDQKEIPNDNINAIKKANLENKKVVLSSGRPLSKKTISFYEQLGLLKENNYFIAYNGESIYEVVSNKTIYSNPLSYNDISKLDNYFSSLLIESARYVHLDENVTVINPNEFSLLEEVFNLKPHIVGNFLGLQEMKAHKYQIADYPDKISKLYEMLPQWIKNEYDVVITMPCYLEITKKNVCKYNSVIYLAKYLGINENEIMAIGDSMNDLSMIKNCHYGVAMGNAIEEIKDVAKIITCDNNSSGVARIINFCL